MELAQAPRAGDGNTVGVVFELYLRHVAETKKPKTLSVRRLFLLPFLGHGKTAEMRVGDLKKPFVEAYIAHMNDPAT